MRIMTARGFPAGCHERVAILSPPTPSNDDSFMVHLLRGRAAEVPILISKRIETGFGCQRMGDRIRRVRPAAAGVLFAALALVIAACACGYGHTQPVIVSGRDFPCRSAISLEGEPTPAEVVALIGAPLERRPVEGGEAFRYAVRGEYGDRVKLFGLVTVSEPHYSWSCEVRLEFRGGHLYSITHTRENNGPDGREKDGPTTRIVRETKAAK